MGSILNYLPGAAKIATGALQGNEMADQKRSAGMLNALKLAWEEEQRQQKALAAGDTHAHTAAETNALLHPPETYGAGEDGVDDKGNPIKVQPSNRGGPPKVMTGVHPIPQKSPEDKLFFNDKGEHAWITPGKTVPPGFKSIGEIPGNTYIQTTGPNGEPVTSVGPSKGPPSLHPVGPGKAAPNSDMVRSQTVEKMATPASETLLNYLKSQDAGSQKSQVSDMARRLPLLGNRISGVVDPEYQNAHNAAVTLATQYLEVMPKSRFQPASINEVLKQIDPDPGDNVILRASKIKRVGELRDAIEARAGIKGGRTYTVGGQTVVIP